MDSFTKIVGLLLVGALVVVFLGLLFSLPVMLLWNACLVAAIPGIKTISWMQAWGIMILCGFLFKNTNSSNQNN